MLGASTTSAADFFGFLADRGRLNLQALDRVQRVSDETGDRRAAVLLKLGLMPEAQLAADMAAYAGLERQSLSAISMDATAEWLGETSPSFWRMQEIVPVSISDDALTIACWDALDDFPSRALQFAYGTPVRRVVATRNDILSALAQRYPTERDAPNAEMRKSTFEDDEIDRLKDLANEAPIIRLVQRVITAAVEAHASDIHFEPTANGLCVRFRLDGMLKLIEQHAVDVGAAVISRIKVMAGLNIAERRLPQDGRIRVTIHGKDIDFRVATSPAVHGESVVLRILDRQDVALDFDALGFDAPLKTTLRAAISQPHGIVLVTGPTGSGKTTTLYAALKEINTPERKLLTVEDPVEYLLDGVNQVPIKPQIGLTFASALRAFLRQDPDIMMVGEIRDRETAEIAIQAALTGHLLLSTLHTNSAAAAITRLLDMGIDDYLLTSTLHLIVGQRLVRKLCEHCKQAYTPDTETLAKLGLAEAPERQWSRAVGCPHCQGSGYRGRTTIVEALPMTDTVRSKVLDKADAHVIEQLAVAEGMRTLLRHGIERVDAGLTTIDEVLRVTNAAS